MPNGKSSMRLAPGGKNIAIINIEPCIPIRALALLIICTCSLKECVAMLTRITGLLNCWAIANDKSSSLVIKRLCSLEHNTIYEESEELDATLSSPNLLLTKPVKCRKYRPVKETWGNCPCGSLKPYWYQVVYFDMPITPWWKHVRWFAFWSSFFKINVFSVNSLYKSKWVPSFRPSIITRVNPRSTENISRENCLNVWYKGKRSSWKTCMIFSGLNLWNIKLKSSITVTLGKLSTE